jgi:4'-phosphopantetheinyl transferase
MLGEGDVHVWHAEAPPQTTPADWLVLCPQERLRASGFRFDRDRDRFVTFRAILRSILSLYLHRSAQSLRFRYGLHAKPFLEREPNDQDIRFNLSHSRNRALIAVTVGRDIGVDLEHRNTDLESVRLACRFLTESESAFIYRHDPDEQPDAFLACWTRKEAWIKAIGCGIGHSMERLDVSASLGRPIAKLTTNHAHAADWSTHQLHPTGDSVAAIVVQGNLEHLTLWRPSL